MNPFSCSAEEEEVVRFLFHTLFPALFKCHRQVTDCDWTGSDHHCYEPTGNFSFGRCDLFAPSAVPSCSTGRTMPVPVWVHPVMSPARWIVVTVDYMMTGSGRKFQHVQVQFEELLPVNASSWQLCSKCPLLCCHSNTINNSKRCKDNIHVTVDQDICVDEYDAAEPSLDLCVTTSTFFTVERGRRG